MTYENYEYFDEKNTKEEEVAERFRHIRDDAYAYVIALCPCRMPYQKAGPECEVRVFAIEKHETVRLRCSNHTFVCTDRALAEEMVLSFLGLKAD